MDNSIHEMTCEEIDEYSKLMSYPHNLKNCNEVSQFLWNRKVKVLGWEKNSKTILADQIPRLFDVSLEEWNSFSWNQRYQKQSDAKVFLDHGVFVKYVFICNNPLKTYFYELA